MCPSEAGVKTLSSHRPCKGLVGFLAKNIPPTPKRQESVQIYFYGWGRPGWDGGGVGGGGQGGLLVTEREMEI